MGFLNRSSKSKRQSTKTKSNTTTSRSDRDSSSVIRSTKNSKKKSTANDNSTRLIDKDSKCDEWTTLGSTQDYYDEKIIIPLLTKRSFYLPGNTWREDWIQWMKNNHIIFGICFHHPLHPIETWERFIVLAGSVAFAMVATNIAYVCDWYDGDETEFNPNHILWTHTFTVGGDSDNNNDDDMNNVNDAYYNDDNSTENGYLMTINVTYGMIILWTFGCTFHSLFDLFVWNLSACACCHPGGRYAQTKWAQYCNDVGSYLLIPFVLALLALAGYSSYLRVTSSNTEIDEVYEDDFIDTITQNKLGDFAFLMRFGIELILTWFVFFPVLSTIVFSGILGCNGRLPLLGGRPRDERLFEEQMTNGRSGNSGLFVKDLKMSIKKRLNSTEKKKASGDEGKVRHSYASF